MAFFALLRGGGGILLRAAEDNFVQGAGPVVTDVPGTPAMTFEYQGAGPVVTDVC